MGERAHIDMFNGYEHVLNQIVASEFMVAILELVRLNHENSTQRVRRQVFDYQLMPQSQMTRDQGLYV